MRGTFESYHCGHELLDGFWVDSALIMGGFCVDSRSGCAGKICMDSAIFWADSGREYAGSILGGFCVNSGTDCGVDSVVDF